MGAKKERTMSTDVTTPLYYTYNQNNSGGSFVNNDRVCHYVIVQAVSPADADRRAENIGIYFDGVADGQDCSCCGDRWDRAWQAGTAKPEIYGKDPREYDDMFTESSEVMCRIYHLNGTITEVKQ